MSFGQLRKGFIDDHLEHFSETELKVFMVALAYQWRSKKKPELSGKVGPRALFVDRIGNRTGVYRAIETLRLGGYFRIDQKGVVWVLNPQGGASVARPRELERIRADLHDGQSPSGDGINPRTGTQNPRSGTAQVPPGGQPVPAGGSVVPLRGQIVPPRGLESSEPADWTDLRRPSYGVHTGLSDGVHTGAPNKTLETEPGLPGIPQKRPRKRPDRAPVPNYPFSVSWSAHGTGINVTDAELALEWFGQWAQGTERPIRDIKTLVQRAQVRFEGHATREGYGPKLPPAKLTAAFVKWVQGDIIDTHTNGDRPPGRQTSSDVVDDAIEKIRRRQRDGK